METVWNYALVFANFSGLGSDMCFYLLRGKNTYLNATCSPKHFITRNRASHYINAIITYYRPPLRTWAINWHSLQQTSSKMGAGHIQELGWAVLDPVTWSLYLVPLL